LLLLLVVVVAPPGDGDGKDEGNAIGFAFVLVQFTIALKEKNLFAVVVVDVQKGVDDRSLMPHMCGFVAWPSRVRFDQAFRSSCGELF
jgi:hypothetical protein